MCAKQRRRNKETEYAIVKYVTVVKNIKCNLYATQNSQQSISGQMESLTRARWSQNIPTVSVSYCSVSVSYIVTLMKDSMLSRVPQAVPCTDLMNDTKLH